MKKPVNKNYTAGIIESCLLLLTFITYLETRPAPPPVVNANTAHSMVAQETVPDCGNKVGENPSQNWETDQSDHTLLEE